MKAAGALLMIFGLLMVLGAFNMDTSVSSIGGDVNNVGLLQKQIMVFQIGLAAFVSGTIFASVGSLSQTGTSERAAATIERADENDEEREAREAGVRRLNRAAGIVLLVAVILLLLFFLFPPRS